MKNQKPKPSKRIEKIIDKICDRKNPNWSRKDLISLWRTKYNFCKKKLKLNDKKARSWTDNVIEATAQTEEELGDLEIK